jgi:alanyl-tRNA synthetase
MGEAYPELVRASALITETLRLEETRFRRTLERGLAILEHETQSLSAGQSCPDRPRSRSTTPTASRSI